MAKKQQLVYVCQKCGYQSSKWLGKCHECGEWNSFIEELQSHSTTSATANAIEKINAEYSYDTPKKLSEIGASNTDRISTGIFEFDRVMGGGLIKGSLVLIGGEPGIGKSTLLTLVLGSLAKKDRQATLLYVSGEESINQIADRLRRIKVNEDNLLIYNETNWQKIVEEIKKNKPKFLVIDSIQTTTSKEIQSAPGTVSQIREVTYELMNIAKAKGITCFVVGHITKDGAIAGPKILEHMVDTVIYFEGDQFGHYRMLRSIKNRFGSTNEVGIFEMQSVGLVEVSNPSQYFLDDKLEGSYGRSLTCVLEGSRSLFVEIQALVVENRFGNGRRTTQGLDSNRLAMLVAIIEKYFGIPLGYNDIYVNVVGGMKLFTRESDLSIIASLLSSYRSRPIDDSIVFLGEVGLTGEVRSVPQIDVRLKEIAQLNYKKVITSKKSAEKYKGKFKIDIIGIQRAGELDKIIHA